MADFTIIESRNMISGAVNSNISHNIMAINTVLLLKEVDINRHRRGTCSSSEVSSKFLCDFLCGLMQAVSESTPTNIAIPKNIIIITVGPKRKGMAEKLLVYPLYHSIHSCNSHKTSQMFQEQSCISHQLFYVAIQSTHEIVTTNGLKF